MRIRTDSVSSPIGEVRFAVSQGGSREGALCLLGFEDGWKFLVQVLQGRCGPVEETRSGAPPEIGRALKAYFDGDLRALDTLAVDPTGTEFQLRVWSALRRIPAGKTASYGELARRLRIPGAARAVGAANGSNPISLVIPCHRVIASDGGLGGYGWGLPRKEWLLRHEGALKPDPQYSL